VRRLLLLAFACKSEPEPPPPPRPSPCRTPEPVQTGEATHYAADGTGKCSFAKPATTPLLVAAASHADYASVASCGTCVVVVGPDEAEILVRVVDRCPACKPGDLDLSHDAFELLAPLAKGRIPIRWLPVPCDVDGTLAYHFKPGSNAQWAAIQVRNHRYPIAALAVQTKGGLVPLERTDYNFFVGKALGPGPYTLRVTDARGQTHVDTGVIGPDHTGSAQLPWCP